MEENFHSGFVAIIGRPNVGKSTLLNYLANQKIAIVSKKPQTTRHKIKGVITTAQDQMIFIDTPGFHKPKDSLGEHLNNIVRTTLQEVDVVAFMVDVSQVIGAGDCYIAAQLENLKTPVILLLNKVDKIDSTYLETQQEVGNYLGNFSSIIPISGLTGRGVDRFLQEVGGLLPQGPQYYPKDMVTDQPEQILISEFIREIVIELTHEEVPYSVAVEVEEIKPRIKKDLVDIEAVIYVERDSQKGIIIGRQGRRLKEIGQRSRANIEKLLGSQIYLQLHVKLKKNWRKKEASLHRLGY